MKQFFTLLFFSISLMSFAQVSFSDDFEAYPKNGYVAANNNKWTTWANKPGTTEDAKVSEDFAKSGKQSIKVLSTVAAGGPTDLVLPFGAKYSTGQFTLKMSMYVPKNKVGYFNLQAVNPIGTTWALDVRLDVDGIAYVSQASTLHLTAPYNQDKWVDLVLDINLTSNIWSVSIDGQCVGAFANGVNSVASMDIYPVNASSLFYVDDVSFDYKPTAPTIASDAGISGLAWNYGRLEGNQGSPTMTLRNNGTAVMTSAEFEINSNGVITTDTKTNLNLAKGKSVVVSLPSISLSNGQNPISVTIKKINGANTDEIVCNNAVQGLISAVRAADSKAVLVEEGTGTWCQWCPRGAVFMDRLSGYYPGLFIPIAVHNGGTEPMKVAEYDSFVNFSAFPSARVNRIPEPVDPGETEVPFLDEISKPATARIKPGARYNPTTKLLEVSAEVDFIEESSGDFYVSVVLTEDGVRGTTAGYNQSNAYAGGAAGVMGGYETLPNPVPASKMVYHHVARAVSGLEANGTNDFSGTFAKNQKVIKTASFTLSNDWKPDSMHIVAILINGVDYVNATSASIDEAKANGFVSSADNVILSKNDVKIYPNPAVEFTNVYLNLKNAGVVKIELTDITGKIVASRNYGTLQGEILLPVQVENLKSGIYLAKVMTADGSVIQKISVK